MRVQVGATEKTDASGLLDVRYVGRLGGLYVLLNDKGKPSEVLSCRTQAVSAREVVLAGPVSGDIGNRVAANLDEIGMIEGVVSRRFQDGFAFSIDKSSVNPSTITNRIAWVKKRDSAGAEDKRRHKRVIPRVSQTVVILPTGHFDRGFIVDMSISGAAVSTEVLPEINQPIAVGSVIGRVVRHFEGGFSMRFIQEQSLDTLEGRLTRFNEEWVHKFRALTDAASIDEYMGRPAPKSQPTPEPTHADIESDEDFVLL